jgi:ABC-2 type transport system permease protein
MRRTEIARGAPSLGLASPPPPLARRARYLDFCEVARRSLMPAFFLFVGTFMFVFLFKAFRFFQSFDLVGEILIGKLLALIFFVFFMFLVLSNINGVIKWFLTNEDLPFLLTNPVSTSTIFFTRSIEALFESSWAFLFFSIPVLLAYYTALAKFKPLFLLSILLLLPYAVIPYGLAFMVVVLLARFLSPKIIKRTFSFLFVLLSAALVITFRAMEIEKLARPESFAYVYDYMRYLSIPAHPLLPTHLFIESIVFLGKGGAPNILIDLGLFLSSAAALVTLAYWTSEAFYLRSYANAVVSSRTVRSDFMGRLFRFIPAGARFLLLKEVKNLKRDPKEWSQALLVFALIFVYVYNFKSFPRDRTALPTVFLESLLSFLNMGLLTFVIGAISVRFVYPSFQLEGKAFWLVLTSPVDVGDVYYRKLGFYAVLSLLFALTLNCLSNHYIASPPFLYYLSFGYVILVALICPVIAFYFGTKFMNLREPPNPYGSLGGMLTMLAIFSFTLLALLALGWSSYAILVRNVTGLAIPANIVVRFAITCGMVLGASLVAMHVMRLKTIKQLQKIEL